jgi:dihydroxy-acid dehydratase
LSLLAKRFSVQQMTWQSNGTGLRSARWFAPRNTSGFIHRSAIRAEGLSDAAFDGRPVVGVCNSWSEIVNCNLHFRGLAEAVKRGILMAGGVPLEFPTMSLGENLMKPTAMLFRNLMSMDVEETIRSSPLDAVVLIGGCDKTVPAQLMGAASVDLPAIMITGGPAEAAVFHGRRLGTGTDLWAYTDDMRSGRMTEAEYAELEAAAVPSAGHCVEMGTASTMATVVEALGMSLPGSAAVPAVDARRAAFAEETGSRAVELARERLRPSTIMTPAAFANAITILAAAGGSTNAVVHLIALAGRVGLELPLERFDELARRAPTIVNVRPAGVHLFEDFYRAGGVPALMRELESLLDTSAMTVTGVTVGENIARAEVLDRDVIAAPTASTARGGLVAVRGSLAPDGAIVKRSAASERLLRHRGPALVFDSIYDVAARIDDPHLAVDADTVLILRNSGPRGGPGMPEWGMLPVPAKLLRDGVTDMVRVSDARMSGTGFGTCVLHVAPEAAVGGPLALVRDGDPVHLDVESRTLDLEVDAAELDRRRGEWRSPPAAYRRGYGALYLEHVLQADRGADFDFLRALPGEEAESEPLGLLDGFIGGW